MRYNEKKNYKINNKTSFNLIRDLKKNQKINTIFINKNFLTKQTLKKN